MMNFKYRYFAPFKTLILKLVIPVNAASTRKSTSKLLWYSHVNHCVSEHFASTCQAVVLVLVTPLCVELCINAESRTSRLSCVFHIGGRGGQSVKCIA